MALRKSTSAEKKKSITHFLLDAKIHDRVHKSPLSVSIKSEDFFIKFAEKDYTLWR